MVMLYWRSKVRIIIIIIIITTTTEMAVVLSSLPTSNEGDAYGL